MISYIVASHDHETLMANLANSVKGVGDDEIVLVENPPSIAAAYNEGQARARNPVRVYVHHDVEVVNPHRLRSEILACTTDAVGLVGLIGSTIPTLPWWDGHPCGSIHDGRVGLINFGPGGHCAVLDGLLLATVHDVEWDETIPGFHGYDYDMCRQFLDRGLLNWCLTGGHELVRHNTSGPSVPDELPGWDQAMTRLVEKWGGS